MIYSPLVSLLLLFVILVIRYFVLAGAAFFASNRLARRQPARKIGNTRTTLSVMRQDIAWSVASSLVFALSGIGVMIAWERGWTRIYSDAAERGWLYFAASLAIAAFAHDTYFYFTHRLLHLPWFMRHVHRVHHLSRQPTAWTSFSFHPLEALIEAVILPLIVLILPLHVAAVILLMTAMTVLGVINHLGYELYGRGFARHPIARWVISATHHQQHHQHYRFNYGLYFTFWDRLLGTHHPDYERIYRMEARGGEQK